MNINSLITKITLVFIFTISLFITVFIFYIQYEKEEVSNQVVRYHEKISNHLFENKFRKPDLIKYVKTLNFLEDINHTNTIERGKIVSKKRGYETILFDNNYYLHIVTPKDRVLFKDLSVYESSYFGYIIFSLFFVLLFIIYFWLIKSVKPLITLKKEISKFSNGQMDINCKSINKDEIADVANEFHNAAKQISLLLSSRQLFLRTIMHELKTPIAKGRIVSELIDDEKQKNRIISIFERLEVQINDFSKIEQVVSKNCSITKYPYSISNLIDDSIKILMIDKIDEKISLENISKRNIKIDRELFSMAVKNLIDNALKYSSDKKVLIEEKDNQLIFSSKGKILEKDIEEYYKPFHNETTSKNHGMGLGLYIVYEILQMHDMHLKYEYNNGMNIFKITQLT